MFEVYAPGVRWGFGPRERSGEVSWSRLVHRLAPLEERDRCVHQGRYWWMWITGGAYWNSATVAVVACFQWSEWYVAAALLSIKVMAAILTLMTVIMLNNTFASLMPDLCGEVLLHKSLLMILKPQQKIANNSRWDAVLGLVGSTPPTAATLVSWGIILILCGWVNRGECLSANTHTYHLSNSKQVVTVTRHLSLSSRWRMGVYVPTKIVHQPYHTIIPTSTCPASTYLSERERYDVES